MTQFSLWSQISLFLASVILIAYAGTKLASLADRLADRTGLGEALSGTLMLGLLTALPGLAASVTAALDGHAALAISNAVGGIAVQTAFLGVADLFYRKANLEHAAASAANMMQCIVLIILLATTLLALESPEVTLLTIHPLSLVLPGTAVLGAYLVYRTREEPMWQPRKTTLTVPDIPDPAYESANLVKLVGGLLLFGGATLAGGVLAAKTASAISAETGISESLMGGLFLAVATSLPELFTSIGAVRQGALTLSVSDIVGGNLFDILFLFAADLAYLQGSIYTGPGVGRREGFLTSLTLLLNAVLLMGLIYRQKSGPANIGFESVLMIVLYVAGFAFLYLGLQ